MLDNSEKDFAESVKNIVEGYLAFRAFASAEEVLQEALSFIEEQYDADHPWVLQTQKELRSTQEKLYNSIELELLEKEEAVLARQELRLTEELLVKLKDKVAGYVRSSDLANAKCTLHEILSLQEVCYGDNDEKTLKTRKELSTINKLPRFPFFNSELIKTMKPEPNYCAIVPQP